MLISFTIPYLLVFMHTITINVNNEIIFSKQY